MVVLRDAVLAVVVLLHKVFSMKGDCMSSNKDFVTKFMMFDTYKIQMIYDEIS
jgi:hypothetical protein